MPRGLYPTPSSHSSSRSLSSRCGSHRSPVVLVVVSHCCVFMGSLVCDTRSSQKVVACAPPVFRRVIPLYLTLKKWSCISLSKDRKNCQKESMIADGLRAVVARRYPSGCSVGCSRVGTDGVRRHRHSDQLLFLSRAQGEQRAEIRGRLRADAASSVLWHRRLRGRERKKKRKKKKRKKEKKLNKTLE